MWPLVIDVEAAMRLDAVLGFDLLGMGWTDWIRESPGRPVDIAYVVCQPMADSLGIDDIAFGRRVRGESLTDVTLAVVESIQAFLPEVDDKPQPELRGKPATPEPISWARLFEIAGVIGVDPRPFTLRQLMWMAKGRSRVVK